MVNNDDKVNFNKKNTAHNTTQSTAATGGRTLATR